jgi:CheY-like chemotaxis protein
VSLEHHVGASSAELRTLVREKLPTVVVLDKVLPDGSGFDLCREIKDDPDLSQIHVILLLGSVMSKSDVQKIAESGCDDVLALPLHSDDFFAHLAQITGVSMRGPQRVAVQLAISLELDDEQISGRVINVSNAGLGVLLSQSVPLGPIAATLHYGDQDYENIQADVVWCHGNERGYAIGLRFIDVPAPARGLLARLSLFQITENKSGKGVTVAVQGVFDEFTDFAPLAARLEKEEEIDFLMQGVSYMGSSGVRAWCIFLEGLGPEIRYSFRNCSLAFTAQAAMVPMVVGSGTIVSVQAPYLCEKCDREETRLVETALVRQEDGTLVAPPLHCHICGEQLEFDDMPARYFAFMQSTPSKAKGE